MRNSYSKLAYSDLNDFVYGNCPKPVRTKSGLVIGGGTIYPELNFTLDGMNVNETTVPDILALSALLTTTMNEQGEVLKQLREAGVREKVKVMVGGGPVTKKFSLEIGADGYGSDAFDAVRVADKLIVPAVQQ